MLGAGIACSKQRSSPTPADTVQASERPPSAKVPSPVGDAAQPMPTLDESHFRRGQAVSAGLLQSKQSVVVRTATPALLDVGKGSVTPIALPGGAEPRALAAAGGHLLVLAKTSSGKPGLFEHRAGTWKSVPPPPSTAIDDKQPSLLAAQGEAIVILAGERLHRGEAGKWTTAALPTRKRSKPGWPKHAVLHQKRLYLGSDSGEWGGELVSLDIDKPSWRDEPPTGVPAGLDLPVRDLAVDRKGTLWVVRGFSHLGLREGMLHRLGSKGFELVASSKGAIGKNPAERGGDWNLDGTAFDAIAFDDQNRPHVLAGSLGIARRNDIGGWSRVTPSWPGFVYVQGFAIVGSTAVIGTYDAGLVLLEMNTGTVRAVSVQ